MSQWYYADRNRNRQGPVGAEELAQLFREGRADLQTLAWRDGLDNWKPLSELAEELGLLNDAPAATVADRLTPDGLSLEPMDDGTTAGDAPAAAGISSVVAPATGTDSNGRAVFSAAEPSHTVESPYTIATPIQREPSADPASPYAAPQASLNRGQAVYGGHIVHAGLWKRFAASIIDSFVTGIATYAVLIPLLLVFGVSMGSLANMSDTMAGGGAILINLLTYPISIGIPALYFGWMQSSSSYASLGKMAVGIKVVRTNGEGGSFWRNFLRYVAYMVFTVVTCGLGVLISGLMVAFSERKQALHDMICDTLVVDKWAFTAHPERQSDELGTVTIVVLALFALFFVAAIAMVVFAFGAIASLGR